MSKPGNIDDGLRAALQAERDAAACLSEIRGEIRSRVAAEVAAGKLLVDVARSTFKVRVGRTPSTQERLREAKRLQKQQERATRCRQEVAGASIARRGGGVRSSAKEDTMSRLIKRTISTTTEEFGADEDESAKVECADDAEDGADDAEEEDDEDEDEEADEE